MIDKFQLLMSLSVAASTETEEYTRETRKRTAESDYGIQGHYCDLWISIIV
jgi:hypothetical protein